MIDRSTHPTVVEYAIRELFKGKSPAAAARFTEKKLSGARNVFLGPGVSTVSAPALEAAIWDELRDIVINGLPNVKPGFEHFVLYGTLERFKQKESLRGKLKAMVVKKMGRVPFPNDR